MEIKQSVVCEVVFCTLLVMANWAKGICLIVFLSGGVISTGLAATPDPKPDPGCAYPPSVTQARRQFESGCYGNKPELALEAIRQGLHINEADEEGTTPLMVAARSGSTDVAKKLFESGAKLYAEAKNGFMPLDLAIDYKHPDTVKYLIEAGVDVNRASSKGVIPLVEAAYSGSVEIATLLLDKKANVNERGQVGSHETPLTAAALRGHADLVAVLINHGADVNAPGWEGRTPLMCAASSGYLDAVKVLVQKGANVNSRVAGTALECASEPVSQKGRDHVGVVKFLLEHGADPRLADDHGDTPVTVAAVYGRTDVIKVLASGGADMQSADGDGARAVRDSVREHRHASLQALLDSGANPNWEIDGMSVLFYSVFMNDLKSVKLLVDFKADVNYVHRQKAPKLPENANGISVSMPWPSYLSRSVLIEAVCVGNRATVKVLLDAGANRDFKDDRGKTALDHAREDKHAELVALLTAH